MQIDEVSKKLSLMDESLDEILRLSDVSEMRDSVRLLPQQKALS